MCLKVSTLKKEKGSKFNIKCPPSPLTLLLYFFLEPSDLSSVLLTRPAQTDMSLHLSKIYASVPNPKGTTENAPKNNEPR